MKTFWKHCKNTPVWPSGRFNRLWSGGAPFYVAVHKYDLLEGVIRRKPFLHSHHKIQRQKSANEHLNKPDAFWKQVLWTDDVKIELSGRQEQKYVWRKKGAEFHEKNTSPAVKHRVGSITLWACNAASGKGSFSLQRKEWIQLNTSKIWKQTSCCL